jgi:penicillin-binding protein 1A
VHRAKAFEDGVTYEATKILEANIQGGTGTHANIGCPAGGKTGTTDHNTDAWFAGFTPRLATAVWVGYPTGGVYMNTQFLGGPVDGGTFPALIWGTYMKQAVGKYCGSFKQPTQPFVSQPFFGHYATTGRKGDTTSKDGSGTTITPPAAQGGGQQQQNGGNNKTKNGTAGGQTAPGTNGATTYDPGKYESPPQGAPNTGGNPPGK